LAFIQRALAAPAGVLSGSPDADRLELRARELAAEYWSDLVWTTGVVPEPAFRRVLGELVPALAEVPAHLVERPVRPVEPAMPDRTVAAADRESATYAPSPSSARLAAKAG
jgi:hypothetical protein